jgi:hypothetical protein
LVYDVSGPFSGENGAYTQTHEVLDTAKLPVFGYTKRYRVLPFGKILGAAT